MHAIVSAQRFEPSIVKADPVAGASAMVPRGVRLVSPVPSQSPRVGGGQLGAGHDATAVLKAFNSWSFKRQQPDTAESLGRAVAEAVNRQVPVPFVLYWGRGPRGAFADPERECLEFLASMARRIETVYPLGADIKLIFTDTHAELNGFESASTSRYIAEVDEEARLRGFSSCLLSDLVRNAREGIADPSLEAPLCAETLSALQVAAAKWYGGEGTAEDGAARYFRANLVEKRAVEIAFPKAIFITFNGGKFRPMFPERMPVFYMYSMRRGVAVKPWFAPAQAPELSKEAAGAPTSDA
jgi:hypothetical protein